MDIQALVDAITQAGYDARKKYHLTLGGLIEALSKADQGATVVYDDGGHPSTPMSYRGYYSDLSFVDGKKITVKNLLSECEHALNCEFEGYKGGEFKMTEETPLWRAEYGCCGDAIIDVKSTNTVVTLITKQVD